MDSNSSQFRNRLVSQWPHPYADFMTVFRFFSAVGFIAYGWANIPYSIWFGFQWSITAKYLLDALIYALVVAATFAWLWPALN